MEKSRNYVVFGVLALVVSLVAVSLAYAGFSQQLNINGSASIKNASWNVHFLAPRTDTPVGTASWATAPALAGATKIGDFSATLNAPGDELDFDFDVENTGTFNAKLDSITIGTPSCSGDNNFTCSQITYKLYQKNGTEVTNVATADGNLAANGGKKTYTLKLKFDDLNNENKLPASDVTVTGLSVVFNYSQDGGYVAPTSTPTP